MLVVILRLLHRLGVIKVSTEYREGVVSVFISTFIISLIMLHLSVHLT